MAVRALMASLTLVAVALSGCASAQMAARAAPPATMEQPVPATPEDCAVISAAVAATPPGLIQKPYYLAAVAVGPDVLMWSPDPPTAPYPAAATKAAPLRLSACPLGASPPGLTWDHVPNVQVPRPFTMVGGNWVSPPTYSADRAHATVFLAWRGTCGIGELMLLDRKPDGGWRAAKVVDAGFVQCERHRTEE